MGRRRKGRAINGVFLLDKPLGESSNNVLQKVRAMYGAAKAGHTGALDPLASGMLPICLGEATKFSQFLLDADKTYEVTATLGIRTTTSDADGEVVSTLPVTSTEDDIRAACLSFVGASKQIPSMFSALKHEGKPLYWYARQGIEIDRPARDITIFALDILRIEGAEVDMRVHCSKGTYIRSLVDDIGQVLGCGAYVSRLHRSQVAGYPSDKMMCLDALQTLVDTHRIDKGSEHHPYIDPLLLPMDIPLYALGSTVATDAQINGVKVGMPFIPAQITPAQVDETVVDVKAMALSKDGFEQVKVYDESGNIYAVAELKDDGYLHPKRVVVYSE
ncbi:MAG: tRNA pseudouridine(55) synthase TruB [Glaciecola sp.]|nr:tRNA pseudouridine(55) synthase TruB [Glaciecola sp.]